MFDILIVDDSAAIRKILQRMLRQTDASNGKILEAGDGQEALELLKTEKVNLILTDINMPNMDGLQLLRNLRSSREYQAIPVIMITTEGNEAQVLEAAQLGASCCLHKPFTVDQIRQKLAELK